MSTGVVVTVGSGVVTIQGFMHSAVGEIFRFRGSIAVGLVVNLTRDDTMNLVVGALSFHSSTYIVVGGGVIASKHLATLAIGAHGIGSVVDALGSTVFASVSHVVKVSSARSSSSSASLSGSAWSIEAASPSIITRLSVGEPLQTGIAAVDSMVPIGRGQRELIVGDRQTGKTSIAVDSILNQRYERLLTVYCPIGQKASSVLDVFLCLVARDSNFYSTIVAATASTSSLYQFMAPYTATSFGEYFMLCGSLPSLLIHDDLTRHAMSYREIYLLLRRPPGREAYPGEIFFVHSRLLERSAKLDYNVGGGSVTCLPIIETLAGDVSAYITTNVISITDGQVFLSVDLFRSGIKPAIDVGLSVTRVGSAAQWYGMKLVAGSYKLQLAQYVELQAFSQFASDLGDDTVAILDSGARLVEMLKQNCGSPLKLPLQLGILSLANQNMLLELGLTDVLPYVQAYLSVPSWFTLFISPGVIGSTLLANKRCEL
jgi:F-type H+-transporting ATPase subunit alpha